MEETRAENIFSQLEEVRSREEMNERSWVLMKNIFCQ